MTHNRQYDNVKQLTNHLSFPFSSPDTKLYISNVYRSETLAPSFARQRSLARELDALRTSIHCGFIVLSSFGILSGVIDDMYFRPMSIVRARPTVPSCRVSSFGLTVGRIGPMITTKFAIYLSFFTRFSDLLKTGSNYESIDKCIG
jgi:hypothetical protein